MVITTDERKYKSIVTDAGKEKIANATLNGKKVNIIYAAIGDGGGSYCAPTPEMTELVNEVWRGEIANKQINPESSNMIDVKIILPADVGGFTAREAGLFDEDGDLIAVCNMPPTEKVVITTGAAGTLTLLIHIVFTDVDSVEFTVNPTLDAVSADDVEKMVGRHNNNPESHLDIREAIQAINTSSVTITDITIPTSGWTEDADTGGAYALCTDIAAEEITEEMIPVLTILPAGQEAAGDCGLCTTARTITGALRVYAQKVPPADIICSLALLCSGGTAGGAGAGYVLPAATETRLGGVKIGSGVTADADGRLSVDVTGLLDDSVATGSETEEMLDDVFGGADAPAE